MLMLSCWLSIIIVLMGSHTVFAMKANIPQLPTTTVACDFDACYINALLYYLQNITPFAQEIKKADERSLQGFAAAYVKVSKKWDNLTQNDIDELVQSRCGQQGEIAENIRQSVKETLDNFKGVFTPTEQLINEITQKIISMKPQEPGLLPWLQEKTKGLLGEDKQINLYKALDTIPANNRSSNPVTAFLDPLLASLTKQIPDLHNKIGVQFSAVASKGSAVSKRAPQIVKSSFITITPSDQKKSLHDALIKQPLSEDRIENRTYTNAPDAVLIYVEDPQSNQQKRPTIPLTFPWSSVSDNKFDETYELTSAVIPGKNCYALIKIEIGGIAQWFMCDKNQIRSITDVDTRIQNALLLAYQKVKKSEPSRPSKPIKEADLPARLNDLTITLQDLANKI